jgi:K+ transporter
LTPAISILSAVEGLKIGTPPIEPYVLPVALALLIGLFLIQRHGTGMVGSFFGPIDPHESTFYIGRQKIVPVPRSGLSWPFKRLLVRLSRVSLDATEFFHIPVERVIEFGGQVEL